jgi:hypothetical protein
VGEEMVFGNPAVIEGDFAVVHVAAADGLIAPRHLQARGVAWDEEAAGYGRLVRPFLVGMSRTVTR